MTTVAVRELLPLDVYECALGGQPVAVQLQDGTQHVLAADMWSRPRPGDDSVIERCHGETLDVGCGSGRVTLALAAAGLPALGIDVSAHAVLLTRRRGVAAFRQNVFARTPDLGRWQHVLLMDGNIGIGGDAHTLLERCRRLMQPAGSVIVEAGAPGTGSRSLMVRLVHAHGHSHPVRWLTCDAAGIKAAGGKVGLVAKDEWTSGGRWFVELGIADA